jgi:hypothetical protein
MNFRIHRLAVAEIDHEVDYYESRQSGLGTELEGRDRRCVLDDPPVPARGGAMANRPDRRVYVLDRFPFTIPYQISGEEIVILALAHTSRRPGYWSRRC